MQNRRAKDHFRQQEYKSRNVNSAVVQGRVLSPARLNYYLADFPIPPPNVKRIMYADYITTCTSGPVETDVINGLNIYLSQVLSYNNNIILKVSTAKSSVTFFTPDTHEHHIHPQVNWKTKYYRSKVLPLEKKSIVLGVRLDSNLTFTQHCNNIAVKVQQFNNVLNPLAGSTWGGDKETFMTTYQAISRSILSFCCPVLTPSPKDNNWSRLQRAQNSAMIISKGCLEMAEFAELHHVARELPDRLHKELSTVD